MLITIIIYSFHSSIILSFLKKLDSDLGNIENKILIFSHGVKNRICNSFNLCILQSAFLAYYSCRATSFSPISHLVPSVLRALT